MTDKKRRFLLQIFEWLESVLFALVFVIALFSFVFKTFTVDGDSMYPNFKTGDYVFAYSFLYTPEQGDVVIIDASSSYGKPLIKRVVAVGGQIVNIDAEGTITVDGEVFSYDGFHNMDNVRGNMVYPLTVPEGHIFVMGDNRGSSQDSRYSSVGFIDVRCVVGKEIYTLEA